MKAEDINFLLFFILNVCRGRYVKISFGKTLLVLIKNYYDEQINAISFYCVVRPVED